MTSATLTTKGQVTIPVDVRNVLGLSAGDRIEFVLNDISGRYEVVPATKSVKDLKGVIAKPTQAVTVDDMNSAVADRGASAG